MNTEQRQNVEMILKYHDLLGELVPRTVADAKIKEELDALDLGRGDKAACIRSALYLRFNFLNESHKVSQGIHSVEGSYWHAIMHRREPDYTNSKYWYRKVGAHPALKSLPNSDPFAFVDFCEAAEKDETKRARAVEVQKKEWSALFEYCFNILPGNE